MRIVVAAVIAAVAGGASASIPDENGMYWGCKLQGSGLVKLIDPATETCVGYGELIGWSQQGPQGVPGAEGPQGIQGPQGPAGLLDSLDALDGLACKQGAGKTKLTYGPTGAVQLACVLPRVPGTWQDTFTQNAYTTAEQCDLWNTFRQDLGGTSGGTFNRVSIGGSLTETEVSCTDPVLATQICDALAAGTTTSIACQGKVWSTGYCGGGLEITVGDTGGICWCTSNMYTARPCIGNMNWGGAGTSTCNAPTQTLRVSCQ